MGLLYGAIRTVSGCDVVVDSSKVPAAAYLARRVPGVDLRLVHLVRASQGVCHSLAKRLPNPDYGDRLMPRQGPLRSAVEWCGYNLALEAFAGLGVPATRVRYEDFAARPRRHLERILALLRYGYPLAGGRPAGPFRADPPGSPGNVSGTARIFFTSWRRNRRWGRE
ncbi:hypothetical protein [Microbispora sp. ATCC PTA-5024]|uniref:hypothetical protein n=1 Tax=Microbispora sp. ATCC PTA-5024 TaxID=316330 RepID=UPI0003DC68F5|nr:hypothetical protein [Microbispora sp. ATCC PTA-5024]ETK33485.1 hypothetical protein MPTA5024_24310 [Microbispora sp. ATCC PTA-5024]